MIHRDDRYYHGEDYIMSNECSVEGTVEGYRTHFMIKCGALPDMRPAACKGKTRCDSKCLNCKFVVDVYGTIPPGGVDQ